MAYPVGKQYGSMRRLIGLILLVCLAGCAESVHASDTSSRAPWLGAAIGEPYSAAYESIGDPTYVSHPYGPSETTFTYLLAGGNAVERLWVVQGRVARIGVLQQSNAPGQPSIADPYGVALLSSDDVLKKARGTPTSTESSYMTRSTTWYYDDHAAVWAYDIATDANGPISTNGKPLWQPSHIESMSVALDRGIMPTLRLAFAHFATVPLPHLREGASLDDALRLPPLSGPGKRYVSVYFRHRPCDQTGPANAFGIAPHDGLLRLAAVSTLRRGTANYLVASAECKRSSDDAVVSRKTIYFTN